MPEFVNTNFHRVYVEDPDDSERPEAKRINPGEKLSASGRYADRLADTPGVVLVSSDQGKEYLSKDAVAHREMIHGGVGPKAFPATDESPGDESKPAKKSSAKKSSRKSGSKPKQGGTGTLTTDKTPTR